MNARIYKIRNLKTGKEYDVDDKGWDAIQKKGWASRYEVISDRLAFSGKEKSFLPPEIAERISGEKQEPNAARSGE